MRIPLLIKHAPRVPVAGKEIVTVIFDRTGLADGSSLGDIECEIDFYTRSVLSNITPNTSIIIEIPDELIQGKPADAYNS